MVIHPQSYKKNQTTPISCAVPLHVWNSGFNELYDKKLIQP